MNRIALITGTSTGLGLELSLKLAKEGYKVYATMRNLTKQDALLAKAKEQGVELVIKELDVTKGETIDKTVAEIIEAEGKIDILVNNAGVGMIKTTENLTEEELQWQFDVNFAGVVRTTKAVLPHMRKARSGHIINITSVGGLVGQPFSDIYCGMKFAVEGYTEALASYIEPNFGIKFSLVEPGGIKSEFANNVLTQLQSAGGIVEDEYKAILEGFIANAQTRMGVDVYQTAEEVAEVVARVVNSENPPLRIRTSEWAEEFTKLKTGLDSDGKKLLSEVQSIFG